MLQKHIYTKVFLFLDGIETVQDSVFINFEIPLLQNTHVATLKSLGKEYTVSFEVYPTSINSGWTNVIHLTTGEDRMRYGDRNPAVFVNPNTNTFHIASAINSETNKVFYTNLIPLKQWSSIKISQSLVNQIYLYCIYVNGSLVSSVENSKSVKLSNVKVYAANPWYIPQSGFIRNLAIVSRLMINGIKKFSF